MAIDQVFYAVVLIVQIQGGKPVGTATGFFYTRDNAVYLVTNRHVVRDEAKGIAPESLSLRVHKSATDLTQNDQFTVPLMTSGRSLWHVHPKHPGQPVDVAVVELDQAALRANFVVKAVDRSVFLPANIAILPGQPLMVIGFPRGFSDSRHNLPIVRNAMVSSAYGVGFDGLPMFLVDANLHPGTSGSPVFTKPSDTFSDVNGNTLMTTGSPFYFLGVHSATIGIKLAAGNEDPLGLATVWRAEVIDQIIDNFKK